MMQAIRNSNYDQDIFTVRGRVEEGVERAGMAMSSLGVFRSHGRFYYEQISKCIYVHLITAGNGTFICDDRPYQAPAGTLFVFFPGQHIRYFDQPESPWRYTYFRLDGPAAAWALSLAGIERSQPLVSISEASGYFLLMKQIEDRFRAGADLLFSVSSAWACTRHLADLARGKPGQETNLVERCRVYLDEQYRNAPTVDELAGRFQVDRTTLYRAFMNTMRQSPKDYINQLRLERAQELLARSGLSVKQVAWASGFEDPSHFGRLFRQKMGLSPLAWRKLSGRMSGSKGENKSAARRRLRTDK